MAITETRKATIANGESLAPAVDLDLFRLFGIQMPAAWTAAALTFQGSFDGNTYADLVLQDGTEVSVTAAASKCIVFSSTFLVNFQGIRFLKVRSGTSGTPVNQGAARDLQLIVSP